VGAAMWGSFQKYLVSVVEEKIFPRLIHQVPVLRIYGSFYVYDQDRRFFQKGDSCIPGGLG
jgi:hypothetical protein